MNRRAPTRAGGARIALQLSGHLRGLCDGPSHFEPLASLVAECRAVAWCDLFVHTWDELHAQTPTWHTWYPSDVPNAGASAYPCIEQIARELRPTSVHVERQRLSRPANATWTVALGRHRETHVSLAGLRSAIYAVAASSRMRIAHERAPKSVLYDAAVRLRPDLYHRRNYRKNGKRGDVHNYRGVPMNQICSVPKGAWPVIARAASADGSATRCTNCVHGCDDETAPGNKSGDMCFWSSPPSALDRLVLAWDELADEYLDANLCWQEWGRRRVRYDRASTGLKGRMHWSQREDGTDARAATSVRERAHRASESPAVQEDGGCPHPASRWDPSAAELILSAAATRERLVRQPLRIPAHRSAPPSTTDTADGSASGALGFITRSAKCT